MDIQELGMTAGRVVAIYVFMLIVVRLLGKRTVGNFTAFDLIVALIISEAVDQPIYGDVPLVERFVAIVALIISDLPSAVFWGEIPVAQGLVAVTTLMLLHILVILGVAHSPILDRSIESAPTPLVQAGQRLARNLAFERVNNVQLDEMLREAKIDALAKVQDARLEPSGVLTVRRTPEAEFARKRDLAEL